MGNHDFITSGMQSKRLIQIMGLFQLSSTCYPDIESILLLRQRMVFSLHYSPRSLYYSAVPEMTVNYKRLLIIIVW